MLFSGFPAESSLEDDVDEDAEEDEDEAEEPGRVAEGLEGLISKEIPNFRMRDKHVSCNSRGNLGGFQI